MGYFNIVFLLFCNYLPLEKGGGGLHLNKFKSPSPKEALCHCAKFVDIGPVVLEKNF